MPQTETHPRSRHSQRPQPAPAPVKVKSYAPVPEATSGFNDFRPLYRGTFAKPLATPTARTVYTTDAYVKEKVAKRKARQAKLAHRRREAHTRNRQQWRAMDNWRPTEGPIRLTCAEPE
jgi:hypothetical protein